MARKKPATEPEENADPLAWMTPKQRERHETLLKKLVMPPEPFGPGGDQFRVLYVTNDEKEGVQTMIWHPDSPEEAAEVNCAQTSRNLTSTTTRLVPPARLRLRSRSI
jgi:hypothetical protein